MGTIIQVSIIYAVLLSKVLNQNHLINPHKNLPRKQESRKTHFFFFSMKKWDIKGADPAYSEVDAISSLALGGVGTEFTLLIEPAPPILCLASFWQVSTSCTTPPTFHSYLFMTCCVTSRLTDDFRSGERTNPVEQFNQIQKDLDHLRNWASRWWM